MLEGHRYILNSRVSFSDGVSSSNDNNYLPTHVEGIGIHHIKLEIVLILILEVNNSSKRRNKLIIVVVVVAIKVDVDVIEGVELISNRVVVDNPFW